MRPPAASVSRSAYIATTRWKRQACTALVGAALIAVTAAAAAEEIAGVKLDDHVRSLDGTELVLNGAGLRTKFFVKVYVGALYLTRTTRNADEAVDMAGPKRVLMHFLYDEIAADKLRSAWTEGFEANQDDATVARLQKRIDRFNAMFPDVREGDEVVIDLDASGATQVTVKGAVAGTIDGADFQRALLRIWLGEDPADSGLKRGMLTGGTRQSADEDVPVDRPGSSGFSGM